MTDDYLIEGGEAAGTLETDYLIIGAGAVGLAFADSLLDEQPDAHITLVDKRAKPGGHWNDAYSFVTLHQPSAFYGVNSMPLGTDRRDTAGPNAGLFELATGAEVCAYYERLMKERLLPSGRVAYLPMHEWDGEVTARAILSGKETRITVRRKTVDATYFATEIPATHGPRFEVAQGVDLIAPNALADLWRREETPGHYAVLGAGKTAMDAVLWLIEAGVDPQAITWVRPRDPWVLNRACTQPGLDDFETTMGGQAAMMEALAKADDADDLFLRLEEAGFMLRIDRDVLPEMYHYPTASEAEIAIMRRVTNVVRKGRIDRIEPGVMHLDGGEERVPENTLFINCTARAVAQRPPKPIFAGDTITLQMVRLPQPTFSAALIAFIESNYADDEAKNRLAQPIPLPDDLRDFARSQFVNLLNQFNWSQDMEVQKWLVGARLDAFAKTVAQIGPEDTSRVELLQRMRANAQAAMANIPKLMAAKATEPAD